jgi:O-methyltransferase
LIAPDVDALMAQLRLELFRSPALSRVGIVGSTPLSSGLIDRLNRMQCGNVVCGVYASTRSGQIGPLPVKPIEQLKEDQPEIVVVASDRDKEDLIVEAVPFLLPKTRLVIAGYSHLEFVDPVYADAVASCFVESLANGYRNSLVHIFQCLKNAARLQLRGIVAEFGMFKGGTTMLMAQFIERLGAKWRIYGFDSFNGFPPPRSPLDMYSYPGCTFLDVGMVRRLCEKSDIEVVVGDIVETVNRIRGMPIVLAFVDTDNYSPARAILEVIQDQVVAGGAIIFDHFTGKGLYTLGERMAAKTLLDDSRYFNLHETGVFLKQL